MRTEHSWTELRSGLTDLRSLLAFRRAGLSRSARRRLTWSAVLVGLITLAAVVVPALLRSRLDDRNVGNITAVLPSLYLGFALLAIITSITSGGGREIIPREQAVAFPVSSVAEHLGALLFAPLNIAWLLQAWAVIGSTAYVLGTRNLAAAILPVLLWIAAATAFGQVVGWIFEGIRRGRAGVWITRGVSTALGAILLGLIVSHQLTAILDRSPTLRVFFAGQDATLGRWGWYLLAVVVLVLLFAGIVLVGLVPARWALHRPLREELRLESGIQKARPSAGSDLAMMLRMDRAGIWRSIPLRRGLFVLALMPGSVALAGQLSWDLITVLPGLVASGGALLFGVNAWCLDGRGALWRDSLPAAPGLAFAAKAIVLTEVLVASATLTLVLAASRAGAPTTAEVASVVAATLAVCLHVVSSSMAWSVRRPFASEMRSARATPAPPVVMVGYSARLALSTTFIGLFFSATAYAADWRPAVLLATPLLCWSGFRLARTARAWADPPTRSRVIAVVAT